MSTSIMNNPNRLQNRTGLTPAQMVYKTITPTIHAFTRLSEDGQTNLLGARLKEELSKVCLPKIEFCLGRAKLAVCNGREDTREYWLMSAREWAKAMNENIESRIRKIRQIFLVFKRDTQNWDWLGHNPRIEETSGARWRCYDVWAYPLATPGLNEEVVARGTYEDCCSFVRDNCIDAAASAFFLQGATDEHILKLVEVCASYHVCVPKQYQTSTFIFNLQSYINRELVEIKRQAQFCSKDPHETVAHLEWIAQAVSPEFAQAYHSAFAEVRIAKTYGDTMQIPVTAAVC
jgi:hypothetical protein